MTGTVFPLERATNGNDFETMMMIMMSMTTVMMVIVILFVNIKHFAIKLLDNKPSQSFGHPDEY